MESFWRRAVGNQEEKINPILVRKYTTTVVHENMPELKKPTANLLCHSLGVAEKKYAMFDKKYAMCGCRDNCKAEKSSKK